jgi:methylenetetrahydrofolate--tRNA-(uracil-5-)-methyltransferase
LGALLGHITGGAAADSYQPMNVNFGLFPPADGAPKKAERKLALTARARRDLAAWLTGNQSPFAASEVEKRSPASDRFSTSLETNGAL